MFNRDLQRERARADALAGRLAELEPLERSTNSAEAQPTERVRDVQPPARNLALERAEGHAESSSIEQNQPRPPSKSYQGSTHARMEVDRLQAALVGGTPLQDYQIRALISAIDDIRGDIEHRKKAQAREAELTSADWDEESRQRLIGAAADILFESQLERYVELVNGGSEPRR
jgi:hypothetical protein